MTDGEIRSICKEKIESLEHWLRRLIDDILCPVYGDYFGFTDAKGNRLISNKLAQQVEARQAKEPRRYPRKIDAVLLEDAVGIICKPELFKQHFRNALDDAFPDGNEEARTFMTRLLVPRNNLSHANAISSRAEEQIICYSNDVIESIKKYYTGIGMQQEYNVPLILKVTDSWGNLFTRSQFAGCHDGGIQMQFMNTPNFFLRPGDILTIEVEIDPSFDTNSYEVTWRSSKIRESPFALGPKAIITITNRQVGQKFDVQCLVTSKKDWHRMFLGFDDFLLMSYKVLPPLE